MRFVVSAPVLYLSASLLIPGAWAPVARAQDQSEAARALFEQGVEASQDERWAEAVELFRRSRAILERPSGVFNTAVALQRMGRVREALIDVERYLEMTTAAARGERTRYAQAEQLRAQLRAEVSVLTLVVSPPTARVEVDGREREGEGAEREIDLDPGAHAIRVSAEGHGPERLEVRLSAGERDRREITLEENAADVGPDPDPVRDPEPEPDPEPTTGGGGLGGIGAAGIAIAVLGAGAGVAALVTGLASQDIYDSLLVRCPGRVCPAGSEGDLSTGEALAWTSTVLLGVTVIGIAVGVALLIVDLTSGSDSVQAQLRVVPTEGGAALRLAL